ncbi:MAG: HD domain-containing phosphohydrolase [Gammaproteobacteria bacterium]
MIDSVNSDRLQGLRVLYVEDDIETREELVLILESWIGELYVAANGLEGLKLYQAHEPEIVITDIQMPAMNGLEMSAEIKALNSEQCIVVLSAYNDVEYLFKALELGIQHYITKPVLIERLLTKLEQIAEQMSLESEAQRNRKLLEQYKLLVDEKAIVCKMNVAGEITYANKRFCTLSGFSEAELIGQPFHIACESEALFNKIRTLLSKSGDAEAPGDRLPPPGTEAIAESRKWTGIIKNLNKAGKRYVVDASIVAIVDEAERIDEYVALMVDITDLYERHERLSLNLKNDLQARSHLLKQYEQALEIGTSLCVIDPLGKIVSANHNFSSGLQCRPEDLVGYSFSELVQDCPNFEERVFAKVYEQGFTSRVMKVRYQEEPEKTLSTIIVGIRDINGEVHSLLSLSQDITDSVRLNEEIMDTQKELLYVMGEVVENRSQETGMHVKRVAELSEWIALKYGLSEQHAEMIKIASPMHDVGKVGIADDILHKPGRLSEEEFEIMKTHASLGYNLLKNLDKPLIKMAANIAHEHHERYDGSGYPSGLSAEQISIEGRIVSLVDVFDALSSERAYKKPWKQEDIIDYIRQQRGRQFDPKLVDIMLNHMDEILAIRNLYRD